MNKIKDLGLFLQVEHCWNIGNKASAALTGVNKLSCCCSIIISPPTIIKRVTKKQAIKNPDRSRGSR